MRGLIFCLVVIFAFAYGKYFFYCNIAFILKRDFRNEILTIKYFSGQQAGPEENISAYFQRLLEEFRDRMETGHPEIGMPILDPLPDTPRNHDWEYRNFFGFLESMGVASSW